MLLMLEVIGALAVAAIIVLGVRWMVKSVQVKEHNAYIGEQLSSAPDPKPLTVAQARKVTTKEEKTK